MKKKCSEKCRTPMKKIDTVSLRDTDGKLGNYNLYECLECGSQDYGKKLKKRRQANDS